MKMARDSYPKPNYFIKALKWLFWALIITVLYSACMFGEALVNKAFMP